MDVHLALGIQRLLDLTPKIFEMTASVNGGKNHGPCIENNLELGGAVRTGSTEVKRGGLQTAAEFPGRFQQSTEHS